MIKKEFSQYISINKIDDTGVTNNVTNWFPLSDSVKKREIELVKKWLKKNFRKTNEVNKILNSDLLYNIYTKDQDTKSVSKGIFIYSLFQESYNFYNKSSYDAKPTNKIFFNISWKNKTYNKLTEEYLR